MFPSRDRAKKVRFPHKTKLTIRAQIGAFIKKNSPLGKRDDVLKKKEKKKEKKNSEKEKIYPHQRDLWNHLMDNKVHNYDRDKALVMAGMIHDSFWACKFPFNLCVPG